MGDDTQSGNNIEHKQTDDTQNLDTKQIDVEPITNQSQGSPAIEENENQSQQTNQPPESGKAKVQVVEEDNKENSILETGDDSMIQEDPHTSFLQPSSNDKQYTTPSKSLPPLKDQDLIVTPKLFEVAEDNIENHHMEDSTAIVASSPFRNNILSESVSLDEDSKYIAKTLGLNSKISAIKDKAAIKSIASLAREFESIMSKNERLKNEAESSSTIIKGLRQQLSDLSKVQSTFEKENSNIMLQHIEDEKRFKEIQNKLDLKLAEIKKSEEVKNAEIRDLKENQSQMEVKYLQKIEEASTINVEQSKKINQLISQYNKSENERFNNKLELTKAQNEINYLQNQKDWLNKELESSQIKISNLMKKHESDRLRNDTETSDLEHKAQKLELSYQNQQKIINELNKSLETQTNKFLELEKKSKAIENKYSKEASATKELLELTKIQSDQRQDRIEQLEAYSDDLKIKSDQSITSLQSTVAFQNSEISELNEKVERLKSALDSKLEFPSNGTIDEVGISLTDLYTEYNHIKKQLAIERSQKEDTERQLEAFVVELDSKKPAMANYRDQITFYESSLTEMQTTVDTLRSEKLDIEKDCKRLRSRVVDNENEITSMKKTIQDLGRQLCYFLIHSQIKENNQEPLSLAEKNYIEKILASTGNFDDVNESQSDILLRDRLLIFKNVKELFDKNQELFSTVRQLTKRLENFEQENDNIESTAIDEAEDAILSLDAELEKVTIKLNAVTKERDALKRFNDKLANGADSNKSIAEAHGNDQEFEKVLKKVKAESAKSIENLNRDIERITREKIELASQLSLTQKSSEFLETKLQSSQKEVASAVTEKDQIKLDLNHIKKRYDTFENHLNEKTQRCQELELQLSELRLLNSSLTQEKEFNKEINTTLKQEISSLREDKAKVNDTNENLQNMLRDKNLTIINLTNQINESNEAIKSIQSKVNEKEEKIQILLSQSEMSFKAQNTNLEQINELATQLLQYKNDLMNKEKLIEQLKKSVLTDLTAPEIEKLNTDLLNSKNRITQLTEIIQSKEDLLVEANKAFKIDKDSFEEKMKVQVDANKVVEEKVVKLTADIDTKEEKILAAERQIGEIENKMKEMSEKLEKADGNEKIYQERLKNLNSSLTNEKNIANVLQQKLQDESSKNQPLTQQIETLKTQAEENEKTIKELKTQNDRIKQIEDEMDTNKANFETEKSILDKKISELENQNKLLLNQLELSNTNRESADGSDDLKQILEYYRREKESVDFKLSTLEEENSSLKNRLIEASKVSDDSSPNQSLSVTNNDKEQALLSEQLDQIKTIKQANAGLTHESNKKSQEITKLKTELTKIQNELNSIKQNSNNSNSQLSFDQQRLKLLTEENTRLKAISSGKASNTSKGPSPEILKMQEQMEKLKTKANERILSMRKEIDAKEEDKKSLKNQIEELTKASADKLAAAITEKDELQNKLSSLEASLKAQFENEIQQLRSTLVNGDSSQKKIDELTKKLEEETKSYHSKLEVEKEKIRQEVEKKFEFKMKILNRKIDKFESEARAKSAPQFPTQNPPQNQFSTQPQLPPRTQSQSTQQTQASSVNVTPTPAPINSRPQPLNSFASTTNSQTFKNTNTTNGSETIKSNLTPSVSDTSNVPASPAKNVVSNASNKYVRATTNPSPQPQSISQTVRPNTQPTISQSATTQHSITQTQPQSQSGSERQGQLQPQSQPQPQFQPQSQSELQPQSAPQTQIQAQPQLQPQPQPQPQPQSQSQPQSQVQAQPQVESQSEPQLQVNIQTAAVVQTKEVIETEPVPQPIQVAVSQTSTQSKPELLPKIQEIPAPQNLINANTNTITNTTKDQVIKPTSIEQPTSEQPLLVKRPTIAKTEARKSADAANAALLSNTASSSLGTNTLETSIFERKRSINDERPKIKKARN
ncbi:MLP1 [Candida pseudojiufengensis]|uniref:MLP1 n=1 Tax=Candida pseudojiufengensis TaxID=497109 RepID=UPI0022258C8A|nr:MLP1 [Candida pseudojiufengensis]KAI5962134.1 MLP1 [Candida pseudojiufengensis]